MLIEPKAASFDKVCYTTWQHGLICLNDECVKNMMLHRNIQQVSYRFAVLEPLLRSERKFGPAKLHMQHARLCNCTRLGPYGMCRQSNKIMACHGAPLQPNILYIRMLQFSDKSYARSEFSGPCLAPSEINRSTILQCSCI
jgi:hypothetical protein